MPNNRKTQSQWDIGTGKKGLSLDVKIALILNNFYSPVMIRSWATSLWNFAQAAQYFVIDGLDIIINKLGQIRFIYQSNLRCFHLTIFK